MVHERFRQTGDKRTDDDITNVNFFEEKSASGDLAYWGFSDFEMTWGPIFKTS